MRRRSDAAPVPPVPPIAGPPAPPPPGAQNWVGGEVEDRHRPTAPVAGTAAPTARAAGVKIDLRPGETLTVTIGQETFKPLDYHSFSVGPIVVGITIQPGETAEQAYSRARIAAETLFEAEFELKVKSFKDHLRTGNTKA